MSVDDFMVLGSLVTAMTDDDIAQIVAHVSASHVLCFRSVFWAFGIKPITG